MKCRYIYVNDYTETIITYHYEKLVLPACLIAVDLKCPVKGRKSNLAAGTSSTEDCLTFLMLLFYLYISQKSQYFLPIYHRKWCSVKVFKTDVKL